MRYPEEFLFFEIRKCINGRNLSLSDIQDVLSQKDDEDQFMYTSHWLIN